MKTFTSSSLFTLSLLALNLATYFDFTVTGPVLGNEEVGFRNHLHQTLPENLQKFDDLELRNPMIPNTRMTRVESSNLVYSLF